MLKKVAAIKEVEKGSSSGNESEVSRDCLGFEILYNTLSVYLKMKFSFYSTVYKFSQLCCDLFQTGLEWNMYQVYKLLPVLLHFPKVFVVEKKLLYNF